MVNIPGPNGEKIPVVLGERRRAGDGESAAYEYKVKDGRRWILEEDITPLKSSPMVTPKQSDEPKKDTAPLQGNPKPTPKRSEKLRNCLKDWEGSTVVPKALGNEAWPFEFDEGEKVTVLDIHPGTRKPATIVARDRVGNGEGATYWYKVLEGYKWYPEARTQK